MADFSTPGLGTSNPFLGQDNPYLQQNIDATLDDVVRKYNTTTQPAFNAAMVKSGSFGNEGVNQMNAESQRQLQGSLGNIAGQMRMQDYTNQQGMYQWQNQFDTSNRQWEDQFNRSIYNDAYGQNMQNLQTGIGLMGTLAGYNQNDLNSANAQQNTPLSYLQQFSQIASGIGGMGSTSTGSSSLQGGGSDPLTSALGGAQLGASAWNKWNSNRGNTTDPFYTGAGNSGSNGGFNWFTGNSGVAD